MPATASKTRPRRASPGPGDYVEIQKHQRALYLENCAGCHRPDGTGRPGVVVPLAGNPVLQTESANNILSVVLQGVPKQNGYVEMHPFAQLLSDQEIAWIVNYVRSSWGNGGPQDVTADQVSAWRLKPKD